MPPRRRNDTHNGRGEFTTSIDDQRNAAHWAEQLRDGMTYRQIAVEADKAVSTIHEAVQRVMKQTPVAAVEEYRQVAREQCAAEIVRLHDMDVIAYEVLRRQHLVVSEGRIVRIGDKESEPLIDGKPVLDSLNVLRQNVIARVRVYERLAKLDALDLPTKSEVNVTNDGSDLATEFAAFLAGVDTAARASASSEDRVATDSPA